MTPDSLKPQRSPEELEAEANILDDHGDDSEAKKLRQRASDLRSKQEQKESPT